MNRSVASLWTSHHTNLERLLILLCIGLTVIGGMCKHSLDKLHSQIEIRNKEIVMLKAIQNGRTIHLDSSVSTKPFFLTYSQILEDFILANVFKDVSDGFYIDVGANEPIIDSVTKHFYINGWHGINIEPLENRFNQLVKDRARDINLRIAVGESEGELELYENDQLTTFKVDQAQKWKTIPTPRKVNVTTLAKICEQYCRDVNIIHFLKVDVEGFEAEVLKGADFKRFRPQVINLEWNRTNKTELEEVLNDNDYQLALKYKWDAYYYDTHIPNLLSRFTPVSELLKQYFIAKIFSY